MFGGQFSETGIAGVAGASRGRGQGWGGQSCQAPRQGASRGLEEPAGAGQDPLGAARGPWGVGAGVWTRGGAETPGAGGSGGQSGGSWSGKDRARRWVSCSAPSPPAVQVWAGATASHTFLRGCSRGFIPNRNTRWQSVYPAARLSRNSTPTSMIFLIYKETKPELFLLYCKQIQVSCLDILQKSPIIINIMKIYFIYRNKS